MNSKKNLKRNLLICLLAGSAVMYTLPLHAATSVIGNNTLPTGGSFVHGNGSITSAGLEMNIVQNDRNAVIKWGSFDVGGSATVNFSAEGAYANNFNTLNYVNSASASQIYGTINAQGGNIFIVNPAGVQIGNSAQINVGSLYVSNKYLNENELGDFAGKITPEMINTGKNADAALMSLGNINASKVTFEGDGRIVIDSERIKDVVGTEKLTADKIFVNTKDENNLVIGYDGYDENNGGSYNTASEDINIATVNGKDFAQNKGYMWVEDVNQLQDIGESSDTLKGNYALRNSIDGTQANNFTSIGNDTTAFTGKFDGIDYNIFNLNINGENNVGLFGKTDGATISNVTLVGGSITGTGSNVGAIVGNANNTTLTNVVNSAAVSGDSNVGGIVGSADDSAIKDAINTGTINGSGDNVGGLIGNLQDSKFVKETNEKGLIGNSYNLGDVSGKGHNVGGLVGSALNSTIGNPSVVNDKPVENVETVYNRMDVTGAYNVGGIVGNMAGSTVQNAENSGTVLASGHYGGEYTFHTDYTKDNYSAGGSKTVSVNVANVGGIAGTSSNSTITDVLNTGDVSSSKGTNNDYYDAGNVGGIVGSAIDTDITNATNRENEVRGAHNVGGVAGYFGNSSDSDTSKDYTVTNGINDGGDIMATGARHQNDFVRETIRYDYNEAADSNNDGKYIVGNIGGVIGYMDGNNVYVTNSANRGTVHTLDITDQNNIEDASTAANVGGVVGKIDRGNTITINAGNINNAAVSNSYNTGDVRGYTAIGGIVGMMYNGEIAGSYNLGDIMSTRISAGGTIPLNMGGIVGDTTENSSAKAYLYDVYNKGQIGDETYTYKGRHVGGIAGRLSGTIEKAYNAGEIYNAAAVTGGIAGYMSAGKINNVFNTGNITVVHNDGADVGVQLGGLVGAANIGRNGTSIGNAYNLGVIRAFEGQGQKATNGVGGVVGTVVSYKGISGESEGKLDIKNVYTTGDLYSEKGGVGAVYGSALENVITDGQNKEIIIDNVVYISRSNDAYDEASTQGEDRINYSNMNDDEFWRTFIANANGQGDGSVDLDSTSGLWRVYDGTTPILNAYLPNSEKYFGDVDNYHKGHESGIDSIQYGTAYNPLLTIIEASKDLSFNWQDLGINNDAGLAVYGAGVTLDNFKATGGTGYYGGLIYADGNLNLDGKSNDISLGSASQIYGSSVTIKTDGKVTIYGDVTATGNATGGKSAGDITVTGGDVDVYGQLTSATEGEVTNIAGIGKKYGTISDVGEITNKYDDIANMGDHYAYTTGEAVENGDITIEATETKLVVDDDGNPILDAEGNEQYVDDGDVNIYYGNKEHGLITTGGNLTVTGTGDVYVDSDLDIGGDLTLEGTGAESEVVLDITNIGQVQAKNELAENPASLVTAAEKLHEFMHHFENTDANTDNLITLNSASGDAKLAVDMWDGKKFDLEKFDTTDANGTEHEFKTEIDSMNVTVNGEELGEKENKHVKDYTYIWVSDGEQLKGIQQSAKENNNFLDFNFALKNDINASDIGNGYEAIGGTTGYNGTFDGRGNRIIGLTVSGDNAGIFSTVGEGGVVKDVNIYSGTFTGTTTAGAVAGKNNGRIEGIVTFGNTVTVTEDNGNAGGIVGVNNSGKFTDDKNDGELTGGIYNVESTGSVIAGSSTAVAGGLVGTNNGGIANSFSDSAVTVDTNVTSGTSVGLGGVVGINNGDVQYVDSLGVTNGGATGSSNIGGIIGTNNGNMYSGYNESIVSGKDNVGGIIGENEGKYENDKWNGGTVANVVNATGVTGTGNKVGGLLGTNIGSVENGRNNGTITGNEYVGGLVGSNAQGATLKNLVNDSSAAITGEQYVGGIAGDNAGTITTGNEETDETVNLINRGTITGQQYVGGVAGRNSGTITNANNDVELNVKDKNQIAQYFGGIAGVNTGTINKATNTADVNADGATYVGGIVGKNDGILEDMAGNSGNVTGEDFVGGVAGLNTNNKPLDGVKASNTGTVFATDGGAGGIFAVNNANITNSKLTNNGTVIGNGGNGTGGIFGVNTGNISTSSLINEVDGQVIGTNNVGGLIGTNTGTITGGRDDADSYYKYQIYNNGVINVGTWTDRDGDGVVDVDTKEFNAQAGSNIGGLIGNNAVDDSDPDNVKTGSLTAGYNTGAINASGSTNVGGIAGSNSGTIDQVFNTVMVKPGSNQDIAITGGTNVGGLVGYNEANGEITNAYNTSIVDGDSSIGNLVGTNSGSVQYVYGVAKDLIGSGTGSIENYYVIDGSDKWLQEGTYDGFTFGANGWKIYNGSTLPMLSVFLTKVTVVDQHLVDQYFSAKHYGEFHHITADDIKALIAIGAISAPDGFGAFNNNNGLIQGVADDAMANSGNWLYSWQIGSSNINGLFNPNNLGYDISLVYSPFENEDWPHNRWDYLFNDAPFDRNKDFRERKAEVNFVDGGMEI